MDANDYDDLNNSTIELYIPDKVKNKIRSKFRKKVKKGLSYITVGKQILDRINGVKNRGVVKKNNVVKNNGEYLF